MAKLTLYHGSENIIKTPLYKAGNPKNDYGYGFYCTENAELAKEWACSEEKDGFANEYSLNLQGLSVLDLSEESYSILNWLAILLKNRTFSPSSDIARDAKDFLLHNYLIPYEKYDIIKGYRADDSYFTFANAFLNNTISIEKLNKAMYLGKLGEQIVLKSSLAFSKIKFISAACAPRNIYYPKKMNRDNEARNRFSQLKTSKEKNTADEIFIIDIIRGGFKNDDSRIPRILFK